MFILTPIAINSSLTSKRTHVCIVTAIATSLAVFLKFLKFSSDLHEYYLTNPNGEDVGNRILSHISKFHDNPTVNETRIVVLLGWFWVSVRKEKAKMQSVFLSAPTSFRNSQW